MKISYNWLKEYLKVDLSPLKIADILTNIGLEVESVSKFETIKGGLAGLKTGYVVECYNHPEADKLKITKVDTGSGTNHIIVCGAPNVQAGQKVVVALAGTSLFKNDEEIVIRKTKIRGIESEGMLCSESEIGTGNSHEGIIVLENDAVIGSPAREYFNIKDDYIFEINLTPNRIDAASHYGVARDLAAYFQHQSPVVLEEPPVNEFQTDNNDYVIDVRIENTEACGRYSGITVSNVTVAESPSWLKERLASVSIRPINNIVDITNFVLFETGQPLHAFDADKINGKKIIVKTLPESTRFITLDEVERSLSEQDLMICDENRGLCMAGVFGGADSGVTGETKNIFIESAYFNPVYIRRTSRRHGLSTDSSFRFERGTDPCRTVFALKRAAILIKQIAGGSISSEIFDIYPNPVKVVMLELNFSFVDDIAGNHIPKNTIKEILSSLEIKIVAEKEKSLLLEIPAYRVDVTREIDIVEEILRIYGFNKIEINDKINSNISYSTKPDKEKLVNTVSNYLSSNSFFEILNNSLTKSRYYSGNKIFSEHYLATIINPISNDLSVMRQTLLYGGLETLAYNFNRRHSNMKFYEFGNCYLQKSAAGPDISLDNFVEIYKLGIFITGNIFSENWITKPAMADFWFMKSFAANILAFAGIDINKVQHSYPGKELFTEGLIYFYEGKEIVSFGKLNNNILTLFGIDKPVYFAEFNWSNVCDVFNDNIVYKHVSKFPEARRDISMILDKETPFSRIVELAKKTDKSLLSNISLFDVYSGDNIPADKKSYAVSFFLQSADRTLTDSEIENTMQKFIGVFEKELGAQIRK